MIEGIGYDYQDQIIKATVTSSLISPNNSLGEQAAIF